MAKKGNSGRGHTIKNEIIKRQAQRITELEHENSELRKLTITDHVTGLYNQRGFAEFLSFMIADARRNNTSLSLVVFDLDNFKELNDRLGHASGDDVLKWFAESICEVFQRATDRASRPGGDEFAVVCLGTNAHDALRLAQATAKTFANRMIVECHSIASSIVTVSHGIASLEGDVPADIDGAIRYLRDRADESMYRRKNRKERARRSSSTELPT